VVGIVYGQELNESPDCQCYRRDRPTVIRRLKQDRHTVLALARSSESSHLVTQLGAEPVIADALDGASGGCAPLPLS
jgi:hypothetical protein